MQHREGHFSGAEGRRIFWQAWRPDGEPRGAVVIAHGASEHGGRYRRVVERLVGEGFAAFCNDHRGHGRSEGDRSYLGRLDHVVADLDRMVDIAAAEHPGRPLHLLGHSMGGCVALRYALDHQPKLHTLALSAPLAVLEAAPLPLRAIARALSHVAPKAGLYEVDAGGISRDGAEVQAYETDPLVHRGKLPARTLTELADAVARFPADLPRLTLPLLVMHGTADRIVPDAGGRLVHDLASSPDKTLELYRGYYHELFNEPAGERERPIGDLVAWLRARTP